MSNRNSKLSVQNWTTDSITPLLFSVLLLLTAFCSPSICVSRWSHSKNFFPGCSVTFLILQPSLPDHSPSLQPRIRLTSRRHSDVNPGLISLAQRLRETIEFFTRARHTASASNCSLLRCQPECMPHFAACQLPPHTIGFALDALLFPQTLKVFPWLAPLQESFPEHCTEYPFSWILCDPLSYFIISVP